MKSNFKLKHNDKTTDYRRCFLVEDLTVAELRELEAETITEIEKVKQMPAFVQADFGNAAEARLGRIRQMIAERTGQSVSGVPEIMSHGV